MYSNTAMTRVAQRLFPAAGLAVAVFATAVTVRVWLGERAFAEGKSAQRRGDLIAATAAYSAATARGNADAAVERARLELLRQEWAGAAESVRAALALAPARGGPHVLEAQLEASRPGPWDRLREERVLGACRIAVALDPGRSATWRDCAGTALGLAARQRSDWDPERTRAVFAAAADWYDEALAREPDAAPHIFNTMLAAIGDPGFLIDVASRRGSAVVLSAAVTLLLDRALWAGAEPELWALTEARGTLPAFAVAAADVLARRGMVHEGLAAARRGLLAEPGDAALALRAADIAARLPGAEALVALSLYRGVVAADPGNLPARRRFATFLAAREMFGEAEREIRAVVGVNPKDAAAWFLLGEVVRRSGRAADAAHAYRAAADLQPGNAAYRRAAGDQVR